MYERDGRFVPQPPRIAAGHDALGFLVEHDAVVGDQEDARQLVRHDDDGNPEAATERDDQVIELDGKPSKEFTLDDMRKAIRLDGKRQVTVNRDGKRVKLVMELGGGRESLMAPVAGAGAAKPAPRRQA